MQFNLNESLGGNSYKGEIEFIVKDKHGRVVETHKQPNIVKIFAKESFSHRIAPANIWNPNGNSGAGAWEANGLNLDDYSVKYMVFGASYNPSNYAPLDVNDTNFYKVDSILGGSYPIQLTPGATNGGGLIKPIPVSEPNRPLKRIERIFFEPSYQPAGVPLLEDDVRAINNIIVFETVLRKEEYNGVGTVDSSFFTITEVALVAAPQIGSIGSCDCDPRSLFLEGVEHPTDGSVTPLPAVASGSATINLVAPTTLIVEGDQIRLTNATGTSTLDQVSPYYLVISKSGSSSELVLDRTPVNSNNTPLTGNIGVMRDSFRIFSHRILNIPVKKSADFEITVRWTIILN